MIGAGRSEILLKQMNMMTKSFNHDTVHQTSQGATNLPLVSIVSIERVEVTTHNDNAQRLAFLNQHLP